MAEEGKFPGKRYLARMQLKATLEEWLKRIPAFSVKPGTRPAYSTAFMRSMHKLELVF